MKRSITSIAACGLGASTLVVGARPSLAQDWQPIPLISQAIRDKGVELGGEGCQWVRAVALDAKEGTFAIFGTDVGGLFRSLDGGRNWEPCNVGYTPRGTAGIAIDPNNPDRVLSIGANSAPLAQHGIYLSTNRAASWRCVLPVNISGAHDHREQVAFDPSSFSSQLGYSTDAYWSRIAEDKPMWGKVQPEPGLYKSTDGGETWALLPNSAAYGQSIVRVHPTARGVVYVANKSGVYRSTDGAASLSQVWAGDVTGLDVSKARPDSLWMTTAKGVFTSVNRGSTWQQIAGEGLERAGYVLREIKVSPADANRMAMWRQQEQGWEFTWYWSADGGVTWTPAKHDNTLAFMPYNARGAHFAWHPNDPKIAINTGGDWPTRSDDGGQTWKWSGSGQNDILVGGALNMNPHVPDTLFFGSQDYNGAVTQDGGRTWTYTNISGNGWGGFCYAGYAITKQDLVVTERQGWGGPGIVKVSHDSGKTWTAFPELTFVEGKDDKVRAQGIAVSCGDPADPLAAFIGPFRTTDAGKTWSKMQGCRGVMAGSAKPRKLFGVGDSEAGRQCIVVSEDGGVVWKPLKEMSRVTDMAYDAGRQRLYVARSEDGLQYIDLATGASWQLATPPDQFNARRVTGVAVDPTDSDIVYMAQHKNIYTASVSVARSSDAGRTWTVLNRNEPLDGKHRDGGREAMTVRVHPLTREAWTAGNCMGLWKIAPPANKEAGQHYGAPTKLD